MPFSVAKATVTIVRPLLFTKGKQKPVDSITVMLIVSSAFCLEFEWKSKLD